MMRSSKIIATIGPASRDRATLKALFEAGMDTARLNFSHGNHKDHSETIQNLRALSQELNRPLSILQDLQGPKLRTGVIPGAGKINVQANDSLILTTSDPPDDGSEIPVTYAPLADEVKPGDTILINDGRIELRVEKSDGSRVHTQVIVGGEVGSRKGINIPHVTLSARSITEKDREDLAFGLSNGVDAVALSFVRKADDILQLREAIAQETLDDHPPLVIAKLERPEAIDNLDAVLGVSDGVMVARGDLGVEVSPERVPSLQKQIIHAALSHQRFVITATQMLESMISSPRPTRAEASDVANAVFDGSDVLMLSGETAVGAYPEEAVQTMNRIIIDAEEHALQWGLQMTPSTGTDDDAVATTHAAKALAHDRQVAALAVFTRSGRSARLLSSARPGVPILAFSPEEKTYQQLSLAWGVIPHLINMANSVEEMIEHVRKACLESDFVSAGQQVVMVASLPVGEMGPPNFTLLQTI